VSGTHRWTMLRTINETLGELMAADERIVLIGEDIGRHGGSFQATAGLQERFGAERVLDAPVSEAGFVGMAVGAAMTGLRPMLDLMFCDFMALAMDQLVNQAAHLRYMTGGQVQVPLVVRAAFGAGQSSGAQHSQSLHTWFAHVPGLQVALPATPADARGLLVSAFADPNPVIVLEDKMEYGRRGEVPEALEGIPFGVADVKRPGRDVTVVATSSMVHHALEAAEVLAADGIDIEVIDPRTIKPLDVDGIVASVTRTGRAVVVDESYRSYGAGAEIAATISERAFDFLEEPVVRLGAADVPVPFNAALERRTIPAAGDILAAVRAMG
jgi:pyruvate/2-oxoglutarate/acetoin dehydrogenase E1 component